MTKSTLRLEPNLSLTDFPVLQSLKYLSLSILASVPLILSFKILRALISRESPKILFGIGVPVRPKVSTQRVTLKPN